MRKDFKNEESKETKSLMPLNLQFFAESGKEGGPDDAGEDDEEDDDDGEEDDDQAGKPGKGSDKSGKGKSTTGKTFTQEQVTRMMAKEKNQGRAAVLRELGIDPKDKKAVAMVKAIIDSQKTEEQKAAEKDQEVQQKVQEASERALKAECKAEALALGAKREFVDDIVVLVMAKHEDGADLTTLIGEIKTKYKSFFGDEESEEDDKSTGKKGTGSSLKKDKGKGKGEEKSLGSRLAAQRVRTAPKTSNFMKRN